MQQLQHRRVARPFFGRVAKRQDAAPSVCFVLSTTNPGSIQDRVAIRITSSTLKAQYLVSTARSRKRPGHPALNDIECSILQPLAMLAAELRHLSNQFPDRAYRKTAKSKCSQPKFQTLSRAVGAHRKEPRRTIRK